MRIRSERGGTIFCVAIFLFIVVLTLLVGVFEWNFRSAAEVQTGYTYYFLVRDCESATAGAVAGESYGSGGAGYLLEGDNAVVLACYYDESDAAAVRDTMSAKGVSVRILTRSSNSFKLDADHASERARVEANARTVDAASRVLYDAANSLERTEISQEEARAALKGVALSLAGLASENEGPLYALWNVEVLRAERKCRELSEEIVFAKDLRYLQIGLCMAVLGQGEFFT